jgi:hypothetical protein
MLEVERILSATNAKVDSEVRARLSGWMTATVPAAVIFFAPFVAEDWRDDDDNDDEVLLNLLFFAMVDVGTREWSCQAGRR